MKSTTIRSKPILSVTIESIRKDAPLYNPTTGKSLLYGEQDKFSKELADIFVEKGYVKIID